MEFLPRCAARHASILSADPGTGVPLFDATFPDDLDTTALAMLHLVKDRSAVEAIMDKMLGNTTADGIFLVRANESSAYS